jgi:hypothetical protein
VPAASPRQSATCRGGKVFHQWFQPNRSSRSPRQPRHGHARLSSLPDIPDGNREDGLPQGLVRRKHPVIPVPVPPGRWDQRYQPVEKLKRRRFDDTAGSGPRRLSLASGPDPMRSFAPQTLGGVELADMFIHETIDSRRLLVIHGDFFDHLTKHAAWVYHLGDRTYTAALHLNKWLNLARRSLGYPYWSFSSLLKTNVKRAVNFINDFEHFVARYTKKKDCCGVVCGHIHVPAIRQIDGVDYYNCADWMEHCTALVEHVDGRIELVSHTCLEGQPDITDRDADPDTLVEPALAALVAAGLGPLSEPRVA